MLNPELQNRFNNSFTIDFPDFPTVSASNQAYGIHIIKEMGKHDVALINYNLLNATLVNSLKTGTPVKITWRNEKSTGEFFGYVSETSSPVAQQFKRNFLITCVGASMPAKERKTKIWLNKTASEIVTDIASILKLKSFVTPHQTRFTQQSLSGQSYFEKITELANKIGYAFQIRNTELHFHPIDEMINRFMTSIPLLTFQNPLEGPLASYSSPTLTTFETRIGDFLEDLPFTRTIATVTGVDPITGKLYSSKSSANTVGKNLRSITKEPLFNSVESKTVTASSAMAASLAKARAQLGRFTIYGKGVGQGDPRVTPWGTVKISGTGLDRLGDGLWIIKKVEHVVFGDGRYNMEFECLTDGTGGQNTTPFREPNAGYGFSALGTSGTRNIQNELKDLATNPSKKKPTSTKLNSKKPLIKQSSSGYKVTPRSWKGN